MKDSGEKFFIRRIHLRNEFMRVGLIDVLDALEDDNSDELQTQLKVTKIVELGAEDEINCGTCSGFL